MNCATHNDTAAVAFCRTCGKPLCANCTRDVRGVVYCEPCLAARLESTAPAAGFVPVPPGYPLGNVATAAKPASGSSGPNPAVAGILAGFFPIGVGAVYCSQYAKGLAHLVIFALLVFGLNLELPWYGYLVLGLSLGFFYFYQIIDAVRTAKAVQIGQPPPDPFGLAQTFGAGEKIDTTKVPVGAVILIALGVLFLLHTVGLLEFGIGRFWPLILIFLGGWIFARQWGMIGAHPAGCTCTTCRMRKAVGYNCQCDRCRMRKITGPAVLVTIGILALLGNLHGPGFERTWPAILLVIGVVKLLQSNASTAGHLDRAAQVTAPPSSSPPPPDPAPPASGEVHHV